MSLFLINSSAQSQVILFEVTKTLNPELARALPKVAAPIARTIARSGKLDLEKSLGLSREDVLQVLKNSTLTSGVSLLDLQNLPIPIVPTQTAEGRLRLEAKRLKDIEDHHKFFNKFINEGNKFLNPVVIEREYTEKEVEDLVNLKEKNEALGLGEENVPRVSPHATSVLDSVAAVIEDGVPSSKWSKEKLQDYARSRKIEVDGKLSKNAILRKIRGL